MNPWLILAALAAVLVLASNAKPHGTAGHGGHQAATLAVKASPTAAVAVAFAESKVGGGYLWGGNGPVDYDCSGLVTAAWARAGVSIPRKADWEWFNLRHVSVRHLQPGDLLFYAGADGTWSDPGHVTIYDGRGLMTEAYSTAVGIRTTGVRWGDLIGAARP